MSERQTPSKTSTADQILDLLLEALLERQGSCRGEAKPRSDESRPPSPVGQAGPATPMSVPQPMTGSLPPQSPAVETADLARRSLAKPAATGRVPIGTPTSVPQSGDEGWTVPPPLPSINLGPTLSRLLFLLVVLVVLVNVPINRYGMSLARIMPDSASLVIRDGLVLKGSGTDVYVLESNKLRWISSLEAFEFFGYRWEQVHVVDDRFLAQFDIGRPIHVLLKCHGSPHIYALENGRKRWIKDIAAFETEGYVWEDVKLVACQYLRNLPGGLPIPEDAGPPPQP